MCVCECICTFERLNAPLAFSSSWNKPAGWFRVVTSVQVPGRMHSHQLHCHRTGTGGPARDISGQKRGQPKSKLLRGAWKGVGITLHYVILYIYITVSTICEFDMILTMWRFSQGPSASLLITHPESEGIFRWAGKKTPCIFVMYWAAL